MGTVTWLVTEKPLVIFSKSDCGISHSVKTVIGNFGANPTIYELDQLPNAQRIQVERELAALMGPVGRRPSVVPAVFIGQQFVGGSNEIMSLLLRGKLAQLLKDAKAIWL